MATENASITLQALPALRRVTRGFAELLEPELRGHLDFLAPLLRPKRLLGRLIEGPSTETYTGEGQAYAELEARYARVYGPLRLHPNLPKPVPSIRVRLELSPWQEDWSPPEGGSRIHVVSPLRWVVAYPGGCSVPALRAMLGNRRQRDEEEVLRFALDHLILSMLLERTPEFARLMAALRFQVETTPLPECPDLRIPVIASQVPSVRPPGEVMRDAVELAGNPTFEEVIDPEAARHLEDPLRERLRALMDEHLGG